MYFMYFNGLKKENFELSQRFQLSSLMWYHIDNTNYLNCYLMVYPDHSTLLDSVLNAPSLQCAEYEPVWTAIISTEVSSTLIPSAVLDYETMATD